MILEARELLALCVAKAEEKKAKNIVSLEMKDLTLICDYFLLMTADNTRQAQAIADFLEEELEAVNEKPRHIEGHDAGRWVLLDCSAVIVHIFLEEEREYYSLERLWGDAPRKSHQ
jgi:ribosome-associated protein